MTTPTVILHAPTGMTELYGIDGVIYYPDATGDVEVPVTMILPLLAAGFLLTSVDPGSITNAMIAANAAIAYAKLALTGAIVNADVATNAAIAKSKLAALAIVNADIDNAAAIASSKLADGPTATPTASKIALYDASGNVGATTAVNVGGGKVVGVQAAAIADAAGGVTVDAEARAALNDLLAKVRTHGLIAT